MKPTDKQMMDYLEALYADRSKFSGATIKPDSAIKFRCAAMDGTIFMADSMREAVAAAMKHDGVIT